ncbi:hypothetical protein BSF41_11970 [Flavobacterium sp. ACN2]|jgi:hypothetical protein|uniref:hypothetical protein n=1 Tax=Flavobacterium sp. ACN2 TaxID=1975676 RepID=UPI000BB3C645|nr:hypothetical protein [Flavobacterium sp. ACN2]PBI91595.1 hypothetical protein BSF41_11970 [Flavobacterium sp. ACN2]
MIQLIWAIVNIATVLGLVIFCTKTASEIRNKISLSATLLFSFFALSFIARPSKEEKDKKFEFENRETKTQSLNHNNYFSNIVLEEDLLSKIELYANSDGENASSAMIRRTGFICGTRWSTVYIIINKTEKKNTFQYEVGGTRKWILLGIEVYSEFKDFKGSGEFKSL